MNYYSWPAFGLITTGIAIAAFAQGCAQAEPAFSKTPSGDQFMSYYPVRAMNLGIEGKGVADCVIAENLTLADCTPASEAPAGYGFADATVKMSKLFRLLPSPQLTVGAHYPLRIDFRLSSRVHGDVLVTTKAKPHPDQ